MSPSAQTAAAPGSGLHDACGAAAEAAASGCASASEHGAQDFGWTLSTLLRSYLGGARGAMESLPGGPRGYLVLLLAASDDGRNQAAIAERLGIDRTVMTYLLDDLEKASLVERTPDPSDRRARLVRLTTTGRTALESAAERVQKVERQVLAGLDDDEATTVKQLLARAALGIDPTHREDVADTPC